MNPKNLFNPPRTLKEKYQRLFYWYKPIHSPVFIKALSFELFKWGHNDKAYSISQFLHEYGIPRSLYFKWIDKYPELAIVHDFTLTGIGIRREEAALHWKVNASVIMKSQNYYSREWRESDEFHKSLTHGTECTTHQQMVHIDMPATPKVTRTQGQKTLPVEHNAHLDTVKTTGAIYEHNPTAKEKPITPIYNLMPCMPQETAHNALVAH